MSAKTTPTLSNILSDEQYVKQRLRPSRSDRDYLTFSDLVALIRGIAPQVRGDVFDFGCGGAPYASLFNQCARYVGADLEPGPAVQRILRPDGLSDEPDASYDFVLSTQVLEHVSDPLRYVQECRRLLRPGGAVLLTTHGMFPEHGCPHDYQRWTAHGLELLFQQAGFEIIRAGKLTTQIRGLVHLCSTLTPFWRYPQKRSLHYPLALARRLYVNIAMPLLNRYADLFPDQSVVDASAEDNIYTAIFVHARKPAGAALPR